VCDGRDEGEGGGVEKSRRDSDRDRKRDGEISRSVTLGVCIYNAV
jgi:hypothetical protein